jgi:choline kinase
VDAILPAAGNATRMRGLPKFLLPIDLDYLTLIENHAKQLEELCLRIWIPVNPDFENLLSKLDKLPDNCIVVPMRTISMTETILNVVQMSDSKDFSLIMPDTFFVGEQPYKKLSVDSFASLACWKIRDEQKGKLGQVLVDHGNKVTDIRDKDINCDYELSWGAVSFSRDLINYMEITDPNFGMAVAKSIKNGEDVNCLMVDGEYFDCGAPREYFHLLEKRIFQNEM